MATNEQIYGDRDLRTEALAWRLETRDLVEERNEDASIQRKEKHDGKL